MKTYRDYIAWRKSCEARNFRGPYQILGQSRVSQFVDPKNNGATAAIWNDNAKPPQGTIFDEMKGETA